ncbi:hypothetical protein GQ44DRAFT_707993 [Phaeosphaeriaceae sp. PMI808]|nr:hypothetical protein GQ44DRAFT_707993 [Phaeosphaeriaceae sp. PMI808]
MPLHNTQQTQPELTSQLDLTGASTMHKLIAANPLYAPTNNLIVAQKKCPRVRTFSPKVRTGCITCRVRRKKCDEEKPTCRRCRDNRAKCDGYAPVQPKKRKEAVAQYAPVNRQATRAISRASSSGGSESQPSSSSSGSSPSGSLSPGARLDIDLDISATDRDFFYHFRTVTVVDFVRLVNPKNFWFRRVLPMCYEDPAVRHVLVALGAAHRFYLQTLSTASLAGANIAMSQFEYAATHHYNKAIAELTNSKTVKQRTSWNIQLKIVICCALFVSLEYILGRVDEAISHMQAGCRLLEDYDPSSAPPYAKQLMQEIATVFLHFGVDAAALTRKYVIPDMTLYAIPLKEIDNRPQPFLNLTEAANALWDLDVRMIHIEYSYKDGAGGASSFKSASHQMGKLVAPFERWVNKFELLLSSFTTFTGLPADIQREILLLIVRRYMWEVILADPEASDEEVTQLCKRLVDAAEKVYEAEESWLGRPIFTLDSDILPAVYLVPSFTEDRFLSQRVINLLRRSRRREGPWDSWKIADELELKLQNPGTERYGLTWGHAIQ